MMRSLLTAAFLMLSAAPVAAAVTIYSCTFTVASRAFLAPEVVIAHDETTDAVTVSDGFILHTYDQPIAGKVATSNANRTTFSWEVRHVDSSQTSARIQFRLTHYKGGARAVMSSQALGYLNQSTANGGCALNRQN